MTNAAEMERFDHLLQALRDAHVRLLRLNEELVSHTIVLDDADPQSSESTHRSTLLTAMSPVLATGDESPLTDWKAPETKGEVSTSLAGSRPLRDDSSQSPILPIQVAKPSGGQPSPEASSIVDVDSIVPRYPVVGGSAASRALEVNGDEAIASENQDEGQRRADYSTRDFDSSAKEQISSGKRQKFLTGRRGSSTGTQQIQLRSLWSREAQGDNAIFTTSGASSLGSFSQGLEEPGLRSGDARYSMNPMLRITMRPTSKVRIAWDIASIGVVGYDALFIPLLVFGMDDSTFLMAMNWFTAVFWTIDVCMATITGFHVNGLIEMRPSRIMLQYMRTWFPLDILIVSSDWFVLATTSSDSTEAVGIVKVSKSLRVTRILRLLRLLRMIRVSRTLNLLRDSLVTEESTILMSVMKVVVGIVLVNHYIGCGWYGVGTLDKAIYDWRHSWVTTFEDRWGETANFAYKYTTCLHWSLTQFTPATMEVLPTNTIERLYAITVLVFALIVFSSLLSSINTAMTQLRKIAASNQQQEMAVLRYLTEKRLSLELGHRIWSFLRTHRKKMQSRKTLHESDVEAFKMLPDTLRVTLHVEIYSPSLLAHPLFHQLSFYDEYLLIRVCHRVMGEKSLSGMHELFAFGQSADHVYILHTGTAVYHLGMMDTEQDEVASPPDTPVVISEMALWLKWHHQGRLVAKERQRCEFYTIRIHDFLELVSQQNATHPFLAHYARLFMQHLKERVEKLTDVPIEHDVQSDMVTDARTAVAHLELLSRSRSDVSPSSRRAKFLRKASTTTFFSRDRPSP